MQMMIYWKSMLISICGPVRSAAQLGGHQDNIPPIVSECYMIDEFTCIRPQNMHIILGHDNVNNNGGGH